MCRRPTPVTSSGGSGSGRPSRRNGPARSGDEGAGVTRLRHLTPLRKGPSLMRLTLLRHRRPGSLLQPCSPSAARPSPPTTDLGPVVGHVYQPTNDATGQRRRRSTTATPTVARAVRVGRRPAASAPAPRSPRRARSSETAGCCSSSTPATTPSRRSSTSGGEVGVTDRIASGGDRPVSITVHDGVGYVLNHDSDAISGLRLRQVRRPRGSRARPEPDPNPPAGSPMRRRCSSARTGAPWSYRARVQRDRHLHRPRRVRRPGHLAPVGGHGPLRLRLRPPRHARRLGGRHRLGVVVPRRPRFRTLTRRSATRRPQPAGWSSPVTTPGSSTPPAPRSPATA